MKKIVLIIICCNFLLVGCWDERLYKELTIVPLMGFEGEPGKLTGHFMYLSVTDGSATYSTVEATGLSVRDSRATANMKTNEILDVTQLEVILLSDGIAKSNLIDMFDAVYRMPNTKLSSRFVLVEGDIAPYLKKPPEMAVDLPDYYVDLFDTAISLSILPDIDIQRTAEYLNDDAIMLGLPFIKISEKSGMPEVSGTALFSDNIFTGVTLDVKESTIIQVLRKKTGKQTNFTYTWKKDDQLYPVSIILANYKRKWEIRENKIDATYKLKIGIEEFAYDHLDYEKVRKELEEHLSKELTKDFNEVIKKLQGSKSDIVGFGRSVRAFHPHLWKKGKWSDTFSELDIQAKVEVEITRTGILN